MVKKKRRKAALVQQSFSPRAKRSVHRVTTAHPISPILAPTVLAFADDYEDTLDDDALDRKVLDFVRTITREARTVGLTP